MVKIELVWQNELILQNKYQATCQNRPHPLSNATYLLKHSEVTLTWNDSLLALLLPSTGYLHGSSSARLLRVANDQLGCAFLARIRTKPYSTWYLAHLTFQRATRVGTKWILSELSYCISSVEFAWEGKPVAVEKHLVLVEDSIGEKYQSKSQRTGL